MSDLIGTIYLHRDGEELPSRAVIPGDGEILIIDHLVQTCSACPSQWEARTDRDNRPVYIRYRHGWLSVSLGPPNGTDWDAVGGELWFDDKIGEEFDGVIEFDEVCKLARISECSPF